MPQTPAVWAVDALYGVDVSSKLIAGSIVYEGAPSLRDCLAGPHFGEFFCPLPVSECPLYLSRWIIALGIILCGNNNDDDDDGDVIDGNKDDDDDNDDNGDGNDDVMTTVMMTIILIRKAYLKMWNPFNGTP